MNQAIFVENALVTKVGEFKTGVGNNGPWAVLEIKVEWEVPVKYPNGEEGTMKQSAIVTASGDHATKVRDMNLQAFNPFEEVAGSRVNIWLNINGSYNSKGFRENNIRVFDIEKVG